MIKFQSFLSSSSGNSTYVTDDTTSILIDCGATGSYLEKCLARVDAKGDSLSAIFITHAHTDHIIGAGVLSRKFDIPIYATEKTFENGTKHIGEIKNENMRIIMPGDDIKIGSLTVHAFSIPHDSEGAVSFTCKDNESKFGIATDSGYITDEILENLSGCDTVIVESNHDLQMLKNGPYPFPLKKRILGNGGHLSNDMCGELCAMLVKSGTKSIWLGHLSDKNNLPDLAYYQVSEILAKNGILVGSDVSLNVIPKYWIGANV